jgi:hypothetical protein
MEEAAMLAKRMSIFLILMVAATVLLFAMQAGAYEFFLGDNNCNQCHTDWPGDTHTFHRNAYACSVCHAEDPIPSSTCSGCHDANDLLTLHGPLVDGEGYQCGYCHEGVGVELKTWSEMKHDFR